MSSFWPGTIPVRASRHDSRSCVPARFPFVRPGMISVVRQLLAARTRVTFSSAGETDTVSS